MPDERGATPPEADDDGRTDPPDRTHGASGEAARGTDTADGRSGRDDAGPHEPGEAGERRAPDVALEDHEPLHDEVEEDEPEPYIVETSLAELRDDDGDIHTAPDRQVVDDRGLDRRVPAWLDTAVQYTWRGLILLVGIAAVLYALTQLSLVTLPIILALILCTLCVPPARRLERRGVPRALAAVIVVIGGLGSLIGILALMAPAFVTQVQELQPTVAEGIDSVLMWLEEGPIGWDRSELEDLYNQAMEATEGAAGSIAASVGTIAVAVGQAITALILALVLLFFFVKDGDQIVRWFITRVPDHHRDTFRAAGARGWVALSGFVRGTAAVALIDAVGIGVGLAIVGVPLVLPLSVLVFFGGFIPVIGATVTGLLAVLVALASGGFTDALIVGGIVLAVQQFESNVLQPTIMRRAVALHPVVILGVLTGGAVRVGIVGAFLAVPVAAVLAAVGNELRLRHEIAKQGGVAGPLPVGGPGVDPETVKVQFPEDTQLRAVGRRRGGRAGEDDATRPRRRRRVRQRVDANGTPVDDASSSSEADDATSASGGDTSTSRSGSGSDTSSGGPGASSNRGTPSHVEVVRRPDPDR